MPLSVNQPKITCARWYRFTQDGSSLDSARFCSSNINDSLIWWLPNKHTHTHTNPGEEKSKPSFYGQEDYSLLETSITSQKEICFFFLDRLPWKHILLFLPAMGQRDGRVNQNMTDSTTRLAYEFGPFQMQKERFVQINVQMFHCDAADGVVL